MHIIGNAIVVYRNVYQRILGFVDVVLIQGLGIKQGITGTVLFLMQLVHR